MTSAGDLAIYRGAAEVWWRGERRWLRALEALVPARLRHFDRLVGSWRGQRVLDLGCGGGFMAEALARRGARVTGVDPCVEALEAARAHAREGGLAIDYRAGRGEALPAATAAFDVVLCVDVLEHVEDVDAVVREIARVLRGGGRLLYDTVNRTALARLVLVEVAERLLGLLPRGTHDPARFLRPRALARRLARAGLRPGPVVGLGPVGVTRRLDPIFGRVPTTALLYAGHATR